MDINSDKLRELVIYQQHRQISSLYKSFLIILEELSRNRYQIDENTYSNLRKRILDSGNTATRELEELLAKFDFILKK